MNALDKAIYGKLAAASGLTGLLAAGTASVFQHLAPQGADPPYVVFNKVSRAPMRVSGGGAVAFDAAVYQVKGITVGESAAAGGTIADQIDLALDRAALSVAGYSTLSVFRDQDVDYPEPQPGGPVAYHRGALYRIVIDPT